MICSLCTETLPEEEHLCPRCKGVIDELAVPVSFTADKMVRRKRATEVLPSGELVNHG